MSFASINQALILTFMEFKQFVYYTKTNPLVGNIFLSENIYSSFAKCLARFDEESFYQCYIFFQIYLDFLCRVMSGDEVPEDYFGLRRCQAKGSNNFRIVYLTGLFLAVAFWYFYTSIICSGKWDDPYLYPGTHNFK